MQRKTRNTLLARILCMMLIVAMALFTVGCKKDEKETPQSGQETKVTELGEGKATFHFTVADQDGAETKYLIHTDAETVGAALIDLGLIEGEDGDYGLYVKKVNGILADYDVNKTYWAFYINGEYAMSGVDKTPVTEGESYMFKVEK